MHHHSPAANRIDLIPDSPIIDVVRLAQHRADIIPLWLGESSFATDPLICDAATEALRDGKTFYTPNRGIPELREAIGTYYHRLYDVEIPDRRVCVTNSGMHAITMVVSALVSPGDNAVLITPCWPNVDRATQVAGGEVREAPLVNNGGQFELDLASIEALCDARTRFIYLVSPSNPTGWVISDEESRALLEMARRRGIAIVSDEVYQRLAFDSANGSTLLSIAQPEDQIYVINSFSKAWSMTGWRLGWMIYPEERHDAFEKLSQFTISGSPHFVQMAGVAALEKGDEIVAEMKRHCDTTRAFVKKRLAEFEGIEVFESRGGFYTMFEAPITRDCVAFCKRAAIEAGVGLAPGAAFGKGGEGKVRLCYARRVDQLEQALDRLRQIW